MGRFSGIRDIYSILYQSELSVTYNFEGFIALCDASSRSAMRQQFANDFCLYIRRLMTKNSAEFGDEALERLVGFLFPELDVMLTNQVTQKFEQPIPVTAEKSHAASDFSVFNTSVKEYINQWVFFMLAARNVIGAVLRSNEPARSECDKMAMYYTQITGDKAVDFSSRKGMSDLADAMTICIKCAHQDHELPSIASALTVL